MAYEDEDKDTVAALEKIKAILVAHDLWATFVVCSPHRVHWMYYVHPSWSCLHINEKTGEARLRAKKADFKTLEQFNTVVRQTAGSVVASRDFGAKLFKDMDQLASILKPHTGVENDYSDPQIRK